MQLEALHCRWQRCCGADGMLKRTRACGMSGQVASGRTTWDSDGDGVSGRQCASACGVGGVGGMGGCDMADWRCAAIVVTPAGGVACAAAPVNVVAAAALVRCRSAYDSSLPTTCSGEGAVCRFMSSSAHHYGQERVVGAGGPAVMAAPELRRGLMPATLH